MKGALSEIIQLATLDSDPWVLMVADILKSFPDTGSLNLDLEEQNPNVQDILGELREKGTCGAACCGTGWTLRVPCASLTNQAPSSLRLVLPKCVAPRSRVSPLGLLRLWLQNRDRSRA